MKDTKNMIRFFTIADYEEEEIWLRSQHKSGWKLVKTVMPCFFIFEKCTPEDGQILKQMQRQMIIFKFLKIMAGNILTSGWDGSISANR